MVNEMATAPILGAAPAGAYRALALSRLRRGIHYIVDEEPEDAEDGPPHFGECRPERRGVACPVCAAAAGGVVPEHVIEAYHVTCDDWSGGRIGPDAAAALDIMGEELDGREEPISFTVDRLWMVRAEMDRLPDFEG